MMERELGQVAGICGFDSPIAGTTPAAHITTAPARIPDGGAKKGTVLVMKAATDSAGAAYEPASAALSGDSVMVVLAEDVDEAGEVTPIVWDAGCFAATRLKTNGTYEMTADDFAYMRQAGFAVVGMVEE